MIPLSVLDLVPVREGGTLEQAFAATTALAKAAERLGYRRFWVANPARMEFLLRQARIEQWNLEPEAAYELLSRDEWERETGPMRVRRLIARGDAAFLLGYLDQGDNSVTEAIAKAKFHCERKISRAMLMTPSPAAIHSSVFRVAGSKVIPARPPTRLR